MPSQKWKDKLYEIFKYDIEELGMSLDEFLGYWPTEKSWDNFQEENRQRKLTMADFEKLRLKFDSDDDFEQFIGLASKDISLLKPYLDDERINSFFDYIQVEKTRSSGAKKLINYFQDLLQKNSFNAEILNLRKKYRIPEKGFPYNEEDHKKVMEHFDEIPEVYALANSFGLYEYKWMPYITSFLFFNDPLIRNRPFYMLDFDLCKLVNQKAQNEEVFSLGNKEFETEEEKDFAEMKVDFNKRDDLQYPIAIRISPYASERDILDFIKRNFVSILNLQETYKFDNEHITIGKSKKKNPKIKERNDFIYEHKNLPRKEIMRLLTEKFGYERTIDYAYIGKIISLETKKRKEV